MLTSLLQNIFINNIYKSSNLKILHLSQKPSKFKYFYGHIIMVCMPMHSLTYVQKGYVVIGLVIIWNQLDEQDKLSLMHL